MEANITNEFIWDWNYESLRRVLEIVAFLGTAILGGLGFFVLSQLKMAKASLDTAKQTLETMNEDMQTRIRREAVVLAVEQTQAFADDLIPLMDKQFDDCKEKGLSFEPWHILNKNFDRSSFSDLDQVDNWLNEIGKAKKMGEFTRILNLNEAFAMYFVGGDESLAFPTLSTVYCSTILRLAPVLTVLRVGFDRETQQRLTSGPYQNSIKLFEIWSDRSEKENLEKQKALITARSEGINVMDIPVLGTKPKP